jgi:hypothetical protein
MIKLEKHDLSALSRTSRKYQEIVAPFFYSSLRIQFRDLETLQKAVNEVLERPGQLFLKYARVLDIVCVQPPWLDTEKSQELWELKDWGREYVHWAESATIRNAFLEPQLRSSSCARGIGFPLCELGTYCPGDSVQGWAPVAELISRLNHLEELNFVADNTAFVSTLLEAITAHHPACCLNIWSHQEVEASRKSLTEADDTPFDLNTLRSKALRALAVTIDRKFSDDDGYDQVDEMLPFLFTGANLKHLIISVTSGPRSDIEQSKREWAEAARALQPTSSAQLESLTFRDHVSPVYLLPKFASIIDLSRLRSLDITPAEDTRLFLDFAPELTTLERLFIGISPLRLPNISTAHVYTDNAEAISAVLAIKPLKYLCLRGLREASNLHRITTHHGPTLRGLILEPYARDNNIGAAYGSFIYPKLGPSNIRLLAKHCPDLKELRLQLRRSEGDSRECDIYRAFGHFQKLRRLILDLHFDPGSEA